MLKISEDNPQRLEKRLEERTRELIKRSVDLDEAKAKGETVLESMADGVVTTGKDRNIVMVNKAGERLLGYSANELLGRKWPEFIKAVDEHHNRISLDSMPSFQVVATGKQVSTSTKSDIYFEKKNGHHLPVAISASPIRVQGATRGVVIVFRDITKEKELDKIQSDFISVASHQLRTPITGIRWVIERFLKREKFSEKGKAYLNDIHDSVTRLSNLIDNLLNVSRIEEGSINIAQEPFDVVRMINEHLKDVAPIASSCKVKVTFKDHPGNLHILSGRNALLNILESVISNAIFYSRGGGSVVIKLDKKIDTFLITVSDTGIGIPEDEQSNIFSKFTRASNAKLVKTDGTGLGLYIAREAVRLLGGKIWFESQQGRGTTFYIELPVHSEPISGEKPLS